MQCTDRTLHFFSFLQPHMRIAIFQTDIFFGEPDQNLRQAEQLLKDNKGAELYVLPEMFTTGFTMRPERMADNQELALRWMKRIAKELDAALCASVAVNDNGIFFNRLYFVEPDDNTTVYDKRHLFTYSGENEAYSSGNKRVTVEYKGVRILLQVCYDLRFPVFSRNRQDYDLAIYVANWPESRRRVWNILLQARAIENQCYVVGVNRVGDDPMCHYNGGSAVISPYGKLMVSCPDNEVGMAIADIDMETLNAFRKKFPVLCDADEFSV